MKRSDRIILLVSLVFILGSLGYLFLRPPVPIVHYVPGSPLIGPTPGEDTNLFAPGSAMPPEPPFYMRQRIIADGVHTEGLGIFRDLPVNDGVKSYRSDRLGISFDYPPTHLLFEGKGTGQDVAEYEYITVVDEKMIREALARKYPSEWPPSIGFYFHHEPALAAPNTVPLDYLEHWLRTKSDSNFSMENSPDGTLTPTSVASVPALRYMVYGLHTMDYVAFTYGEWIVLANAARYDDTQEDEHFGAILNSVTITRATSSE